MNISIKGGDLVIGISQLLERLSADEIRTMAQAMACESDVLKAVVDQLVDGWTEDVSHGSSNLLHELRVRILERVSDVRLKVVRELMRELAIAKHNEDRVSKWAWAMYHAWPSDDCRMRPELPKFAPEYPSDADVRAAAEREAP